MRFRAFLATSLVVATASLSASAQNQPWIKDRRYAEGIGYRAGNLELHPGVSAELGYDSNYFLRADDEKPVISVMRLRVTPSLSLSTLGPQRREGGGDPPKVNFRAGTFLSYNKLFATDSAKLTASGRARLEEFFRTANAFGYAIYGHTDSRASHAYNQGLSERRAASVAAVARSQGAVVERQIGFGETMPIVPNNSAANMQKNRRVEVICYRW